jgi:nucleotide-binding universal stress UspA family protein
MTLKHILLHLDNRESCRARIDTTVALAASHNAHLTGIYMIPNIMLPVYADVYIPPDIIQTQQQEAHAKAEQIGAQFREAVERAGVSGEWHAVEGFADQQIRLYARYCDLVVVGQSDEDSMFSAYSDLPDQVILGSARPVLFIPRIGVKKPVGQRILVAWNGSREAVRAVYDALPLLQTAAVVKVIAVNPPAAEGDIPTADICQHLARHGVNAEGSQIVARDIDTGNILLSHAADQTIDLIVLGAYGHTRLRESVLGGVTKQLLAHMTVPVLMSH